MKIQIVYIAAGKHYISMFDKFVTNLEHFAKEDEKIVSLLTNEDIDVTSYELNNISIEKHHIDAYPWPIIALFKFHHIYNVLNEDADIIFYVNCNYLFKPCNSLPDIFRNNKLYLFKTNNKGYTRLWNRHNWYNVRLPYALSTIIAGSYEELKNCCDFIIQHIDDLLIKNIIEEKHDESALNHYYDEIHTKDNYLMLDLEDYGFLDFDAHDNGNIEYHRKVISKYIRY